MPCPKGPPLLRIEAGFTLVELVMVIVVLGIVSASLGPRLFNYSTFQERGFFDDTLSALRYAQKLAVATGCNVRVGIAGNQFQVNRPGATDRSKCSSTTDADFTQAVVRPGSGEASYTGSQSGIAISDATIFFNAKGSASTGTVITVGSRTITVVQATGFVYDSTP